MEECVQDDAHPTCAAALADAFARTDAITFQINRCLLDAPLQEELLYTQDGRLFISGCRLRDATGGVDVDVVANAVPALYGCETADEVAEHIRTKSLTSTKKRLNVRGILRDERGTTKRYVVLVATTPLDAVVSTSAMRLLCGLSAVTGDVVIPVPATYVVEDHLVGMAVRRDAAPGSASAQVIGASRVLLLVRGTSETKMSPIAGGQELSQQHFKVESTSASCLLSDTPARVNLVGYCDFGKMMAYRLDTEAALVLASAVDFPAPGSASAADAAGLAAGSGGQSPCPTFTMEHVTKLSKDEVTVLARSLAAEWKAVLTAAGASDAALTPTSAKDSAYWSGERPRKVRRIISEPFSPIASAQAVAELTRGS